MIADYFRVARLYFVLLAIFTVGRLAQGAMGVSYDKAHHVFSLVTLTLMAAIYFGAFCRRWRGYTLLQAMGLGLMMGVIAQVVIFTVTVISYAIGANTFFNHPTALNVTEPLPLGDALLVRARGLVFGPILMAVGAAIGWALGGLLPERTAVRAVSIPIAVPASGRTADLR